MAERTCGEIIQPFIRSVAEQKEEGLMQIVGGNGSAALSDPETRIDLSAGQIYAPEGCDLPVRRGDGSLRDVDVLVMSVDPTEIDVVAAIAEQTIGDQLRRSVFGLKPLNQFYEQRDTPIRSTATVFLGDRYVSGLKIEGGQPNIESGYKAVYPFAADISSETLETFTMRTPNGTIAPVPHPGETILNYLTRSISGLRPKDVEKVQKLADIVLGQNPEIREWIYDGPGRSKLELARVLHTLREPKRNPDILQVGRYLQIQPLPPEQLKKHPMLGEGNESPALVAVAHAKARVVHFGERQQRLVTAWLNHVEPRIKKIVYNS